ncbi:hypothetical protein HPP92_027867 [Vanilla planifolia]|uniref:AT3G52170-like helix-turn-helix domain-containing protein n=1 Tax=Vanilla planifolia TaxID=51239 RepID=A0A835U4T0_VANPL|nr:hypothetical protein HPP92_027867 [Vanilla planifolia]
MLGLKASWVGHAPVPISCSSSRENKPRARRTKEERRKMVESFIKKYQNKNNGKFPSLNLTHKEVGGSFYIVREIVRDIIQENRVLGPGKPSSKVLNFEDCLEEETHFFEEDNNDLSIPASGHAMIYKIDSIVQDVEVSGEKSTKMIETFSFEYEEGTSLEVMHVDPNLEKDASNGMLPHEKLVNTGTKESNAHNLMLKKDCDSEESEKIAAFVQLGDEEDIVNPFVKQQGASYSPVPDYSFARSDIKNEARDYIALMAVQSLEESLDASTTISERFSEKILSCTETTNGCPNHDNGGIFSSDDETLDQDDSSEKSGLLSASKISQVSNSSDEVHLSINSLAEGDLNIEYQKAGFSTTSTTSKDSSSMGAAIASSIIADEEPPRNIMQYKDMLSIGNSENHLLEDKSINNLLLQAQRSSASGATENDVQLADKKRSLSDTCIQRENTSSKLLEPNILEEVHSGLKAEKETSAATGNGGSFVRSNWEAVKDTKKIETNAFWNAMKAFISSLIKFWSE